MPYAIQLRTPVDVDLLREHLLKLCAEAFEMQVVSQEESALGPRNVIRVEFSGAPNHSALAEAMRQAYAEMQARVANP